MAERQDTGDLAASKVYSDQFVQRVPKSLHRRLATRAAAKGVGLNQLAATYLARLHVAPGRPQRRPTAPYEMRPPRT